MVLEGETIALGAPDVCPDCGVTLEMKVLRSNAGFYIGTQCNCGPYSRESGYFKTYELAHGLLIRGDYGR